MVGWWKRVVVCGAVLLGCGGGDGSAADAGAAFDAGQPVPRALSAGAQVSCLVDGSGEVECWGFQVDAPPAGPFEGITIDVTGSCALREDGFAECWNGLANPFGQFESIALGDGAACGLRADRSVYCWQGIDEPGVPYDAISVAGDRACGIDEGAVSCWGNIEDDEVPPERAQADVVSISMARQHLCAVDSSSQAFCWGAAAAPIPNGSYQKVEVLSGLGDNAPPYASACGLTTSGEARCWNAFGPAWTPSGVFVDIAVGNRHVCGVRADGAIRCWGDNDSGQAVAPGAPACDDTLRIAGRRFTAPVDTSGLSVCLESDECEERCSTTTSAGNFWAGYPAAEKVEMRALGNDELPSYLFIASMEHLQSVFLDSSTQNDTFFVMTTRAQLDDAGQAIGQPIDAQAGHVIFNIRGAGESGAVVAFDPPAGIGPFYFDADRNADLSASATIAGLGGALNVPVGGHRMTITKDGITCEPLLAIADSGENAARVEVRADTVTFVSVICTE